MCSCKNCGMDLESSEGYSLMYADWSIHRYCSLECINQVIKKKEHEPNMRYDIEGEDDV